MIAPGATIGMLGGGQLGRMSLLAGRRMGYKFVVLDPSPDAPAAVLAEHVITADFADTAALDQLASLCDVVTLEFENIPASAIEYLQRKVPVYPGVKALHICQNRRREKSFLQDNGFPCAKFAVVHSAEELAQARIELGHPCVLKTADFGYDGKGQRKLNVEDNSDEVWSSMGAPVAVLEQWISYTGEYSVICARSQTGECVTFPVAHNVHRNHILHTSTVPCGLDAKLLAEAQQLGQQLADRLEVVGLLAVELFLTANGWLVNEMAPRPHNSGHYSFDACLTSQFEQHIRAIAGLPLGDTRLLRPVAMVNLLGDVWQKGEPDWKLLLSHPCAKLHLYGKSDARIGRKMGHYCVLAASPEEALASAVSLEHKLTFGHE
ncbi:MAG: 5-(carboxyamino)imidazole ribonucleotide synthase [Verrucomicrobia bacterium]|nr:5-(carboxyamino)imidazole ribonucleotide synthase [Verrucomicrobiota bacterium]